jgi:hypothetical protein
VNAKKISLIRDFPKASGWYATEQEHGIPVGDIADQSDLKARYLWRNDKKVGPIARGFKIHGMRGIDIDCWNSLCLGALRVSI